MVISFFIGLQILLALSLFIHDILHSSSIFRLHSLKVHCSSEFTRNELFKLYSLLYLFPVALVLLGELDDPMTQLKLFAAFNGVLALGSLLALKWSRYFGCIYEEMILLREHGRDYVMSLFYEDIKLSMYHLILYLLIWICFVVALIKLTTLAYFSV